PRVLGDRRRAGAAVRRHLPQKRAEDRAPPGLAAGRRPRRAGRGCRGRPRGRGHRRPRGRDRHPARGAGGRFPARPVRPPDAARRHRRARLPARPGRRGRRLGGRPPGPGRHHRPRLGWLRPRTPAGRPPGPAPRPLPPALELLPAGPVRLRLAAPASKSVTNRALLCAALAAGTSHLAGAAASDDAGAMAAALAELGAEVAMAGDAWTVAGTGGRLRSPERALDARLSGTTMRFLAATAALTPGGATVTGAPPLLRRPVGPLVAALRALGGDVAADGGGRPPVTAAGGGLEGGRATVD